MIVPRNRLLCWVAIVIVPCSISGALFPSVTAFAVIITALLTGMIMIDAVVAPRSLDGIRIALPDVVRLSKSREGAVEIFFRNEHTRAALLRVALPLPAEIYSPSEYILVSLPPGSTDTSLQWPCTPHKRGRYIIDACYFEGSSYFGFWGVRSSVRVRAEVRVYPGLQAEQRNLAALFLNRGMFGTHPQRQVGQGREFEKLREYIHGDSYENIHWKATAKRGKPITKVFQIERTQEVYVILDASRLSARPLITPPDINGSTHSSSQGDPDNILDRFITSALVMGIAAERHGDQFGLLHFSDRVNNFIRAKSGRAHYNTCRDVLFNITPQYVNPDFDEVCSFICSTLRRRALLVFLTNLDDPVIAESFSKNMDMLRRKHVLLATMLKPIGAEPLFSHSAGSTDEIYTHLGGHIIWHSLREFSRILQKHGVGFRLLNNERMCNQLVSEYVNIKKRQLI